MAEDTGKIYIIVTNKIPGGSGGDGVVDTESRSESSKDSKSLLQHYAMNKFINTVESAVKSGINFGLNNIGNFTGDYILQTEINHTRQLLHAASNIVMSAWAGFKVSRSPWGALIGAGASVIGQGVSTAESLIQIDIQTKKTNYAIDQIRERSGLNSRIDGSRGTEN